MGWTDSGPTGIDHFVCFILTTWVGRGSEWSLTFAGVVYFATGEG